MPLRLHAGSKPANVCVYPDAQVKFHQAYNGNTREADLGVSAQLFDSYPAAVQGRLGYLTDNTRC